MIALKNTQSDVYVRFFLQNFKETSYLHNTKAEESTFPIETAHSEILGEVNMCPIISISY